MIAVPYFEKALYEMDENELSAATCAKFEKYVQDHYTLPVSV
jgi:hypothetical protein